MKERAFSFFHAPFYDIQSSSSREYEHIEQTDCRREGFGRPIYSIDNNEHELQMAGRGEDILRGSMDDIAPSTHAEMDEDTIKQDTNSNDGTDRYIARSSISSILVLTVS